MEILGVVGTIIEGIASIGFVIQMFTNSMRAYKLCFWIAGVGFVISTVLAAGQNSEGYVDGTILAFFITSGVVLSACFIKLFFMI